MCRSTTGCSWRPVGWASSLSASCSWRPLVVASRCDPVPLHLNRNAVRAIVGEDFECGPVPRGEDLLLPRHLVGHRQLARRELAVQAVFGAARRVVIRQADERILRRGYPACDLDLVVLRFERPVEI